MLGQEGGEPGVNDDLLWARTVGIGATIMGRNLFGPIRGSWSNQSWRGWWGEDPPFGLTFSCSRTTRGQHLRWFDLSPI